LRYCHHNQPPAARPITSSAANTTEATAKVATRARIETKPSAKRWSQDGFR